MRVALEQGRVGESERADGEGRPRDGMQSIPQRPVVRAVPCRTFMPVLPVLVLAAAGCADHDWQLTDGGDAVRRDARDAVADVPGEDGSGCNAVSCHEACRALGNAGGFCSGDLCVCVPEDDAGAPDGGAEDGGDAEPDAIAEDGGDGEPDRAEDAAREAGVDDGGTDLDVRVEVSDSSDTADGDAGTTCGLGSSRACPPGQVCDVRHCDAATGTCVPIPDPIACPPDSPPVCGCDGRWYANDCERLRAHVALDGTGAACGSVSCVPECRLLGSGEPGWFDPCLHRPICTASCRGCTPVCRLLPEEGWYAECSGVWGGCRPGSSLIAIADCERSGGAP